MFKEKGYEIVLSSPKGGPLPIDKACMGEPYFTDACKKFMHDADAVGEISHTVKLDTIDFSKDVDAMFMTGGHGVGTDFINNPSLKSAIETMYNNKKIVSAVCHGPICLAECNKADGTPLVQGLTATGFSDSEEDTVQLTGHMPYLIEGRFKELGAKYEKADDWNSKVCVDGNLITGQNPQSSDECAQATIKAIEG